MPGLHPLFVHFPIALFTAGVAFDIAAAIMRTSELQRTGWWCQLVASVSLIGTVVTGLIAESLVNIPDAARETFEAHEQYAFIAAAGAALLLFWRIASRTALPKGRVVAYLGAYLLFVALLWVAAWYGGELVYRFGVGVRPG